MLLRLETPPSHAQGWKDGSCLSAALSCLLGRKEVSKMPKEGLAQKPKSPGALGQGYTKHFLPTHIQEPLLPLW